MGAPKATDTPTAAAADSTCAEARGASAPRRMPYAGASPSVGGARAHLSPLGFVLAVLGEEVTQDVGAAAGHVHQGALFPQAEAGGHGQDQGHRLGDQGPLPQVAADDEAAQDGFDLGGEEGC